MALNRASRLERILREVVPIVGLILMVGSLRSAVADWNQVPTGSMKPTIIEGDRIFVNKLAYELKIPFLGLRVMRWSEPRRGDIIVFFSPDDHTRLVKRVVGLPGDRLEMHDNKLIVNGFPATYGPIDPEIISRIAPEDLLEVQHGEHHVSFEQIEGAQYAVMTRTGLSSWGNFEPEVVPTDHYFTMGDNRDNSADSRVFGFVPSELIVGRATAVVVSISPEGDHLLRWQRLLADLR